MEVNETALLLPTAESKKGKSFLVKVCSILLFLGSSFGVVILQLQNSNEIFKNAEINLQKHNLQNKTIETTVAEGRLFGKEMEARNGRKYVAFLGVPYAKPPLDDLRFMPPRDPEPWTGMRNATEYAPFCPMHDKTEEIPYIKGSEDCLYLNIFTSNRNLGDSKTLYPVMLYLHGGGRGYGTGQLYTADYFMEENVVLVTLDYRNGPLGTLSLNIPEASGNQGLKDQAQALRWIQKNIRNFGGNPQKVTLFGNSGGSFQVSAHTLSPISRGLFQRVIMQSGTVIFPAVLSATPEKDAKDLASISNCPINSTLEILSCLKKLPADVMVTNALRLPDLLSFTFSVDTGSLSNDKFLPDYPLQLLNNQFLSDIPTMIGVTSAEGLLNSLQIFTRPEHPFLSSNQTTLQELVIKALHFDLSADRSTAAEIAQKVIDLYIPFGMQPVTDDLFWNVTNMFSDRQYMHPAHVIVQKQLETNSAKIMQVGQRIRPKMGTKNGVYLYYFSHKVEHSLEDLMKGQVDFEGLKSAPAHGDDLQYLYPMEYKYPPITKEESHAFSRQMIKLWTNFAETGEPGVAENGNKWMPVEGRGPYKAFELNENPSMIDFLPDRMDFWNQFSLTDLYR